MIRDGSDPAERGSCRRRMMSPVWPITITRDTRIDALGLGYQCQALVRSDFVTGIFSFSIRTVTFGALESLSVIHLPSLGIVRYRTGCQIVPSASGFRTRQCRGSSVKQLIYPNHMIITDNAGQESKRHSPSTPSWPFLKVLAISPSPTWPVGRTVLPFEASACVVPHPVLHRHTRSTHANLDRTFRAPISISKVIGVATGRNQTLHASAYARSTSTSNDR